MAKRFYPQHLKRKRRRLIFAGVGVGVGVGLFVVLSAGFGAYRYERKEAAKPTWETYTNSDRGVELQYPSNFEEVSLSEESKEAGVVWEIKRKEPPALFSLRYEDGLGALKITGGTIFDALVATVNRRYPDRFPDYKKESYEEFVVASEKAAQFGFTYTGADGKTRVKQRFVLVVKDDTAYYLSCQSPEKEFFKSEKDCDRIIDSFEFLD